MKNALKLTKFWGTKAKTEKGQAMASVASLKLENCQDLYRPRGLELNAFAARDMATRRLRVPTTTTDHSRQDRRQTQGRDEEWMITKKK